MDGEATTVLAAIPRDVVENIARNYRELEALRRQQSATQAKMIRACLAAFEQTTEQAQRKLERERRHLPPHKQRVAMHEPSKLVRDDKLRAKLHLEALATMLENEATRGLDVKAPAATL